MKDRKASKYHSRSSRVFAPVHINSKGVIDYKLPLCDLMDSILSKKSFNTSVITDKKVTDTISYKKDLGLNVDMVIEVGSYFYRLPLCEFIDNIIRKTPDILNFIYFGFEGDMYYITLEFDGKDINYIKYSVNNSS